MNKDLLPPTTRDAAGASASSIDRDGGAADNSDNAPTAAKIDRQLSATVSVGDRQYTLSAFDDQPTATPVSRTETGSTGDVQSRAPPGTQPKPSAAVGAAAPAAAAETTAASRTDPASSQNIDTVPSNVTGGSPPAQAPISLDDAQSKQSGNVVDARNESGQEEEDEELRQARELAMAIQENPNMTMEQVHQLLAKRQNSAVSAAAKPPPTGRLANPLPIPQLQNPFAKQSNLMKDWNRLQGNMFKILQHSNKGTDTPASTAATAAAVEVPVPTTSDSAAITAHSTVPSGPISNTSAPGALTLSPSQSSTTSPVTQAESATVNPSPTEAIDTAMLTPIAPPPASAPPLPPSALSQLRSQQQQQQQVSSSSSLPAEKSVPQPPSVSPTQSESHVSPKNSPKKSSNAASPSRSRHGHGKAPERTRSLQKTLKSGVKSGVKSVKKTVTKTMVKTGVVSKHEKVSHSPSRSDTSAITPPASPRRSAQSVMSRNRDTCVESVTIPDLSPNASAIAIDSAAESNKSDAIRLSGTVWKRRSGFGKYSVSAAWERRRLVLRGTTLWYYKMSKGGSALEDATMTVDIAVDPAPIDGADANPTNHNTYVQQPQPQSTSLSASSLLSGPSIFQTSSSSSKSKGSWLEQTVNKASASLGMTTVSDEEGSNSRGHLDIVKEKASVAASFGHSGAPTPFALSIKLNGITKWKLCFDSHAELMQWLATLTDCVVQGSVDAYNKELLLANDPAADIPSMFSGQLSEPPINSDDDQLASDKPGLANEQTSRSISSTDNAAGTAPKKVSGHRLWTMGAYSIKNQETLAQSRKNETGKHNADLDDTDDNSNDEEISLYLSGGDERTLSGQSSVAKIVTSGSFGADLSRKSLWNITDSSLVRAAIILNLAMAFVRSSALSPSVFWYVLVFVNFALFSYLSRNRSAITSAESVAAAQASFRLIRKRGKSRRKSRQASDAVITNEGSSIQTLGSLDSLDTNEPQDEQSKPIAGTTAMQIDEPRDIPVNEDGHRFPGWRRVPPSGIDIRSQGYATNGKKKVPSPGELYKLMYCDIFESPRRLPDMASKVQLPHVSYSDDQQNAPKTWSAPDIFVISIALPTDPPKMTRSSEDGGGFIITMYFVMKQETRDILRRVTAEGYDPAQEPKPDDPQKSIVNATKLFDEWCRRAPTDDKFMARFKCVPNAQNLKEIGLPSWIASYNGKPFLIKRPGQTGFLYRHPENSCMEFDISLHPFPYIAKKGICFMKDTYFKKVLVTFGFTIEGRADEELPECLIGLMQLCYPDPDIATQSADLFEGRSPKSFSGGVPRIINCEVVS